MTDASPGQLGEMWPGLLAEIQNAGSILVASHVNPDGDALGSALAFSFVLDQLGKSHQVLFHHPAPKYLGFLPGIERITNKPDPGPADLAILLDLEAMDRIGDTIRPALLGARKLVVIDHHQPHEEPGDIRIVSTKSPATAAILADLWRGSDVQITPDIATLLLVGILTDTGNFRFPNTTPHCMHVAADLLEAGAKLRQINEAVYLSKPLPAVKLFGKALANLQLTSGNQIAWTTLTRRDFEQSGAIEEDTEGFVNELLAIDTVRLAAILRESASGRVKISIRSQGPIDTTAIARQFGGGGHINASGAHSDEPIEAAAAKLVQAMATCLESS
ncbi:MAG: bifunctional oligoribonuclease/PAP phosphatase NrnA [Armatimonadetes bacterium]|nr:bifunctional oligoribonuclease/PAP phosphatase NrnA [Armatimonadota bacterium]MBS1711358.1 bifunctional oligoribonuclease/PAP phosphatase NrnA [Armatimonadota bacterium]MBX3107717.1 bifunctional oligoribonuclease/PAP phosphatase NrnA [Fimbriimonadaceae bacterium]